MSIIRNTSTTYAQFNESLSDTEFWRKIRQATERESGDMKVIFGKYGTLCTVQFRKKTNWGEFTKSFHQFQ